METLLLGAVAYDAKVVTIWEGFAEWFRSHDLPFDYVPYTNYDRQVEAHLDGHLDRLPPEDLASRAVVEQMKADEVQHASTATDLGGAELPLPLRLAMRVAAKVMTITAHRI